MCVENPSDIAPTSHLILFFLDLYLEAVKTLKADSRERGVDEL
jgi:hypothetical protein